jgi:solute carrier family 25 (mitochondrial iron transporter), member 28/37
MAQQQQQQQDVVVAAVDDDWEEWDGTSPFWIHCVAGSLAGVVEHTAVYPLDTVRTHIQVCASCLHRAGPAATASSAASVPAGGGGGVGVKNALAQSVLKNIHAGGKIGGVGTSGGIHVSNLPTGMWQTMRFLVNEPMIAAATTATLSHPQQQHAAAGSNSASSAELQRTMFQGYGRLWRGVQTILIGCIPAHALYFSAYETVKSATVDKKTGQVTAWGSSLAGAAAVLSHDVIMTPLDTMKQRMQLGHYQDGVVPAFRSIIQTEGWKALYRSFPITLATNIPYGMVMVSTHEVCKQAWSTTTGGGDTNTRPEWQTVLMASSLAGLTASAITTPLDRIKTALQTQELAPACLMKDTISCPLRRQQEQQAVRQHLFPSSSTGAASSSNTATVGVRHATLWEAAASIHRAEGMAGFARGLVPRILSHTPAVAISWTTYETAKHALLEHYHYCD